MKRDRYEKGFIVEFLDGTRKLIKNNQLVSYQMVPIPDPDNPMVAKDTRLIQYNQDYIIYSSPQIKYGMIPTSGIKDLYQVKYRRLGDRIRVFDAQGKDLFDLS